LLLPMRDHETQRDFEMKHPFKLFGPVGVCASIVITTATAIAAAVWTTPGKVTGIYTGYGNRVEVHGLQNAAACTNGAVAFESTWANVGQIQDIATAALLSGRNLRCYVDGCVGGYQKGLICNLQ
jgi:hypothetical protein